MYIADQARYQEMKYQRCGQSGLKLSRIALGMWHNFGGVNSLENSREMMCYAFDHGITYFDLANNYGPPYGSAEETFGKIMRDDFRPYRDEMVIASKAGYDMWPGPYGNFGSKKYLIASLDQSLKRMGLDYVDIFYHHRPDPDTPMEETMEALAQMVRQGKALYVGISSYNPDQTREACKILKTMGIHLLIHQPCYSMFNRWVEDGLYDVLKEEGIGSAVFSPLAQGLLTSKYFNGIPENSRAGGESIYFNATDVTEERVEKAKRLDEIAKGRGQSLAQMALSWVLRKEETTSVIIGASRTAQIEDNLKCLNHLEFSEEELNQIDRILLE